MIEFYSDGAYSSSRNQGGWAFVVVKDGDIIYKECGGVMNTTNNRMEIIASMKALEYIKNNSIQPPVKILTDSMYVIGTLTLNWKRNKNLDLWAIMDSLINSDIEFVHVKGHEGHKYNEECNKWAIFGSNLLDCETDLKNK